MNDLEIKRIISLYVAHGFISIDWETRKWRLNDCSIIRMPNSDGIAYIAGPRITSVTHEIIQNFGGEFLIRDNCYLDHFLPNILIFSYDNFGEVIELSNRYGIDLIVDPDELIHGIENSSELIRLSAPLPSDTELLSLKITKKRKIEYNKTSVYEAVKLGGLYKHQNFGLANYFWIEGGECYHVDKRYGIHRSASIDGIEITHWEKDTTNDFSLGTVSTSKYMPFPSQVEKILVILSGSSPEIRDELYLYKNISYWMWERINSFFHVDLNKGREYGK